MSNRKTQTPAGPVPESPKSGETWRHFKGGVYRIAGTATAASKPADGHNVVGTAVHSETHTTVLIYGQPEIAPRLFKALVEGAKCTYLVRKDDEPDAEPLVLYSREDRTSSDLWARPLSNFMSTVGKGAKPDAPRFALVQPEPEQKPGPSN